jgi:hypothetical protein
MSEFLYHYRPVEPATWFYLSSLLAIGLFFKFSRMWSVRNLDLLMLILLAPGLLFIHYGRRLDAEPAAAVAADQAAPESTNAEAASAEDEDDLEPTYTRGQRAQLGGYAWLFGVGLLWLARLLADPTMVRRPLLEPNLTAGGLTFIGCSLFVFLMANVISRPNDVAPLEGANARSEQGSAEGQRGSAASTGQGEAPGYALLASLPGPVRKAIAILAHLVIVVGMVLIGYRHFDNIVMGIGAATLYLMLPYTALMTNEIAHALPAAFLIWAVLCYRRPLASGIFLGLAGGIAYYPLFLLPLWVSFYWPRGLWRFLLGVVLVLILLLFVLFSSPDVFQNVRLMFGLKAPSMENLQGIWDQRLGGWSSYYRFPVLAAFIALACSMALWPAQKNLGTLLSCSAAVMLATQFWHGYGGGLYMAWYLPLLLLTIFRPNLEDRVALTVLAEGWLPRRLSVP